MAPTTLVVIGKVSATKLTAVKRELRKQGAPVATVVRVPSAWLCSYNDYDEDTDTEQFMLNTSQLAAKFGVTEYELEEDDDLAVDLIRDFITSSTGLNIVSDLAGVVYNQEEHPQADSFLMSIFRCTLYKIHPV